MPPQLEKNHVVPTDPPEMEQWQVTGFWNSGSWLGVPVSVSAKAKLGSYSRYLLMRFLGQIMVLLK